MTDKNIFLSDLELKFNNDPAKGEFVSIDNEEFYKISNCDRMNPFLISIVSSSDHWIYISSRGGLTAGRKNPDNALFPYLNDDQLHDNSEITGNKTILKIIDDEKKFLWEPFSARYNGCYSTNRNLYKNIYGTKIIFEEVNNDLNLIFKYGWCTSNKYGIVKFSELNNISDKSRKVVMLDGIQNILPSGLTQQLQTEYSTLVDGYKKNELFEETGLALYTLSSIPSDVAQPSESLLATTVFCAGITSEKHLLSSRQLNNFRNNLSLKSETKSEGIRGSYFIESEIDLNPGDFQDWLFIVEVNQNAANVIELQNLLKKNSLESLVSDDIKQSQISLKINVAKADGLQLSDDKHSTARHFSNVLFNIMRGGVFENSYTIEKKDFVDFIENANPYVMQAHSEFINELPDNIIHSELLGKVDQLNDVHFTRLTLEYLPLTFSRRHGDPSRPWNRFSIEIRNNRDEKVLNYQGNWRDIFQNWEALALSYPKFIESMIAKFLNTSTVDGYNPYRIFRDGFDWEIQEPDNPWANLGYWGDHQIIYLLKLLELSVEYNPGSLDRFIDGDIFSFANVPYRLKDYQEILSDPRNTIEFDDKLDRQLKEEEKLHGSDCKFLKFKDHTLVQVNLLDKLILTLLVKLSNFIPSGGIWLNTQRPEWNDANNALVGNGISMVTLYYIRRYINFLIEFLRKTSNPDFKLSKKIADYFDDMSKIFRELKHLQKDGINDQNRKTIVDKLGKVGSEYRRKVYNHDFTLEKAVISSEKLFDFLNNCLLVIDNTIAENKREDNLYHSYNILQITDTEMRVSHLYEMLEGQVAVLSSGYLSVDESIDLLAALKTSKLYREDHNSYMLYPHKLLPGFLEKNNLSTESIKKSDLLTRLIQNGNKDIIFEDLNGGIHFQSDIINSTKLKEKLKSINDPKLKNYVEPELSTILEIYEETFNHNEFTGRANTFYKYEGLGSIYWHMVSKLLLAVQEVYFDSLKTSASKEELKKIKEFYFDIKDGIGITKQPMEYGAFPTIPHSHTPSFAGAQQPGMTGQVKEDIICRLRELGIKVNDGSLLFETSLLRKEEFLTEREQFTYYDLKNEEQNIMCEKDTFAFTYCQVPFIIKLSDEEKIVISQKHKEVASVDLQLNEDVSQSIFKREGKIAKVEIYIDKNKLR